MLKYAMRHRLSAREKRRAVVVLILMKGWRGGEGGKSAKRGGLLKRTAGWG